LPGRRFAGRYRRQLREPERRDSGDSLELRSSPRDICGVADFDTVLADLRGSRLGNLEQSTGADINQKAGADWSDAIDFQFAKLGSPHSDIDGVFLKLLKSAREPPRLTDRCRYDEKARKPDDDRQKGVMRCEYRECERSETCRD